MYTGELFEEDDTFAQLTSTGISVHLQPVKTLWKEDVTRILTGATLSVPEDGYMQTGSSKGVHTEYLGHILTEMQYLQRAYPDATW